MARFIPYPAPPSSSPPLPPSRSGAPPRFLPPQAHPEPPPLPPPSSNGYNLASTIQDQPRKIEEILAPYFASMRAEIESLKASIHYVQTGTVQLQQGVSKVQHDISKISSDVSDMGETLSTVVRGQQLSVAASSSFRPLNAQPGRVQAKSRDAMPSTDVEMMDPATQYKARPEPSSSPRTTPAHLSSHVPIRDPRRVDTATNFIQRHWNPGETPGRFSKFEREIQVSAPSQSTPAPARQCPTRVSPSSRGSPVINNSFPHSAIRGRSEEPNEVQQLPSPPEIPNQSQSEEAFVQSQLQRDSQSPSQSLRDERLAVTQPVKLGKGALLPSSSVSSSTSNSTGLFSPISPQIPSLSRNEALKNIMDLLQRQEEGMPIASFAIAELPDLQYPTQPEMEEEGNGEKEHREFDTERNGGNVEKGLDEVGMTGYIRSDEKDPFASQTNELRAKGELQPQKSMGKKMPLFLPDSEPPSVKSMSPVLVIPTRRDKSPDTQSQQPYYDREDEGQGKEHDHKVKSPDSSQDIRRPVNTSSDEVEAQLTTLSEIESSEESSDDEGDDDGEEIDELLSVQGEGVDHDPESFDSQVECERTLLMESQRREEGYQRGSGVEPESGSQDELARMLIPQSQEVEGGDGEVETGSASQAGVARMLLPESQRREEGVEDGYQRESGVEPESGSQDELMRLLTPQSREVEGSGGEAETGSVSQAGVARMLLPESQVLGEGTIEDIRPETELESESQTQLDLSGMLIPQSQIGDNGEDEAMENVPQEPETQIDLPKMLIPQSQEGECEGREEVEATRRESSPDSVPSNMNAAAEPRDADNNPMTIVESSIDKFTPPRTEVRDSIESFQSMEERQEQGQGQEEFDRQMQVDDDGSQPQFENYHHEAGHLSPDLSCREELEKSSPGQLGDSVQPMESNPLYSSPLSSPHHHDAQLESLTEPSPLPSTQVPNNHCSRRESGTGGGVMPPSPLEPVTPVSSMPMRNRTQQQAEPVALPDYISPVNSPSPSKSPLPALVTGRKRRFQELQSLSIAWGSGSGSGGRRKEQVKQVQLVSPTQGGREKNKKKRKLASASISPVGAHNVGSGSGKRVSRSSDIAKALEEGRSRVGLMTKLKKNSAVVGKGEGRSEENPICLSSDPSTPTDEVVGDEELLAGGKGKEGEGSLGFIDLTGSPISRSQAAKAVEEQGSRKGKEKEKEKEKEREKEKEKDNDKDKDKDKKEAERKKKKDKEKKMMPVGTEDSDDAEVIPARAFKVPKAATRSTSDDEQPNRQRNGKRSNGAMNAPILNLNGIRDRQNKAMTKVKRKTRQGAAAEGNAPGSTQKKAVEKDGEPPLKRARGRSDVRDTSNAAAPVASSSKGKSPRKDPTGVSTTKVKWPKKRDTKSSDDRNFVRCDKCNKWYHYGCVGVSMGDDSLKDDASFTCPPCSVTEAWGQNTSEGRRSKRQSASRKSSASEICARPDCSYKDTPDDREFWVNRIVGRKVKVEGGRGRVEVYLVEWEGYRLAEATWQEEDTMGNPADLIEEFVCAARKEGIDLDRDPSRAVFLKDAQEAGWTADD